MPRAINLRVLYAYDEESHGWGFRVPSLGIVGSADTREEAEEQAREAILFALDDDSIALLPEEETGYFHVVIEKAATPQATQAVEQ